MSQEQKSYRIRTAVGNTAPTRIDVKLSQTFDTLQILSLELSQENAYRLYNSSYGVIVGRILANGGFGIPNSKVSVFIEVEDDEESEIEMIYPYTSVSSSGNDGVRYNLLPDEEVNECHQNVGTFPNKRLVLDNKDEIEVFDKYWKYTTVTNEAGDYMLFGIPTGSQTVHVDIDLSDVGVLSQRPRDMIYKGYDINLFDSPSKFKQSTNLNSLAQIVTQDKGIYVYPFWGDTTDSDETVAITRCDIEVEYKFEPTCVFMGSIITDTSGNAIAKNCTGTKKVGRMEELIAGEGSIEIIRKTFDGRVEQLQIKGDRVIDGNGVWCYQIPMNLDYVRTDEYGNIIPTDDPDKGIPTRARVRFRVSLDECVTDTSHRKRAKYLIPNNPRIDKDEYPLFTETLEPDYEFGSATRDESYCDLLWNKVYTVKSYIPRIQKTTKASKKNHTGIKAVNYHDDSNPFPYNNLTIKLSFTYRLICIIIKVIIIVVTVVNVIFSLIGEILGLALKPLKFLNVIPFVGSTIYDGFVGFFETLIPGCVVFSENFCDDGINNYSYAPGCWGESYSVAKDEQRQESISEYTETGEYTTLTRSTDLLITCIENSLMQEHDGSNMVFANDWINGCLYAPLWYRKNTEKKTYLFGLITKKSKDQWCSSERNINIKIYQPCALNRQEYTEGKYESFNSTEKDVTPAYVQELEPGCKDECHEQYVSIDLSKGVIVPKVTSSDATIYYYKPLEYDDSMSDVVLLFATDIVLLGSLNDCDINGLPQFFKRLDTTTFQIPEDILLTDYTYTPEYEDDGETIKDMEIDSMSEMSGCDWGNTGSDQCDEPDGGLFYGVGCSSIDVYPKSCINLSRVCEFGVSLDDTKFIHESGTYPENEDDGEGSSQILTPDGFISYDELYDLDGRSMFATLNGNKLRTKLNSSGMYEYDIRYLYPENFDGSLYEIMLDQQGSCDKTAKYNYSLEKFSEDYYRFRMGDKPFYYDSNNAMPRYENSFYFYFGIKAGETAIEQFNSQFFASCVNTDEAESQISYSVQSNDWCSNDCENWNGYIKLDLSDIDTPYSVTISSLYGNSIGYYASDLSDASGDCSSLDSYLSSITYTDIDVEMIYFSNGENDEVGDDYVLVNGNYGTSSDSDSTSDDDVVLFLLNDIYVITVTDANGNETSVEVNMANKYVSFALEGDDFDLDDTTLLNKYSNSYCDIAQETPELSNSEDDSSDTYVTRESGGVITVKNLYYLNNSILSGDDSNFYLIVVKDVRDSDGFYVEMTLCTSGGSKELNVITAIVKGEDCDYDVGKGIYFSSDEGIIAFGLPYYDTTYSVTVTQLCSCDVNDTTSNKYTLSVEINGPKSIRLEINDIDYSLISNFTSGADCDGSSVSKSGSVYGWTSLSDYTDNGPYNWSSWLYSEKSVLSYYEELIEEDGECEVDGVTYTDATEALYAYRKSVIKEVKEAFWMGCNGQSLQLYLISDYAPFTYSIIYKEEESSEFDDLDDNNVLSACDNTTSVIYEDGNTIDDIEIPTLSYEGSEFHDSSVPSGNSEGLASYYCVNYSDGGTDNERYWKHPYFVKATDANGNSLPYGDNVYFGVHFLDKSLSLCDMIALAYIDGIPYYMPSDTSLYGETLTKQGFLAAIICNGIADWDEVLTNGSSQSSDTFLATFETQTLGGNEISILTVTVRDSYEHDGLKIPDEDAMPTKRIIVNLGDNYGEYPYYNYINNNDDESFDIDSVISDEWETYMLMENEEMELTVEDDNCVIYETIYGGMSITAEVGEDESFNSSDAYDVTIQNVAYDDSGEGIGVTEENVYNASTTGRQLTINVNSGGKYSFEVLGIPVETYLFEYSSSNYLITQIANGITGYGTYEDCYVALGGEIDGEIAYSSEYQPVFNEDDGIVENGKYFAISVTENGCRAISPVYDFTMPVITEIRIYDASDGSKCTLSFSFSENYYLKYYSVYGNDGDSIKVNSVTVDGNTVYGSDDMYTYENVESILLGIFVDKHDYRTSVDSSSKEVRHIYSIDTGLHDYIMVYVLTTGITDSICLTIDSMEIEIIDYVGIWHKCTLRDVQVIFSEDSGCTSINTDTGGSDSVVEENDSSVEEEPESESDSVVEENEYTVTLNLTNVSSNTGTTYTVDEGENTSFTLAANDGYSLPDSITVSGTYDSYDYDEDTGKVTIVNIQSDITVTAAGEKIYDYIYTRNYSSDSGTTYVISGDSFDDVQQEQGLGYSIYDPDDVLSVREYLLYNSSSSSIVKSAFNSDLYNMIYIRAVVPISTDSDYYNVKVSITVTLYMSNDEDISMTNYDKSVTFSDSLTETYIESEYAYVDIAMNVSSYFGTYTNYLFVVTAKVDSITSAF